MVKKEVINSLLDTKKSAILRVVLNAKDEMYLKEIAEQSGVSMASTYRILKNFVANGYLIRREWKTSKVYVAEKNEKTAFLREIFEETYDGLSSFVKSLESIYGVINAITHGVQKKNKANVLLIGKDINRKEVDLICADIKKQGFEITYLTLEQDQYEQMSKMGLYPGEKRVLK